jgi:hypothetical protein
MKTPKENKLYFTTQMIGSWHIFLFSKDYLCQLDSHGYDFFSLLSLLFSSPLLLRIEICCFL